MKKNIKSILIMLTLIALTIIFFSYNIVICVDSSHYCWLSTLIKRGGEFANWDTARGLVFPLIIKILTMLIGKNVISLQIGMFIAYAIVMVITYFIYKYLNEKFKLNNAVKVLFAILAIFLIILNPLIYGYYHTILTEFIAMTACIVGAYFSWKWIEVNFNENKVKYIIYTIYLAVSVAFMWHLKQPYVLTIMAPIIISVILSIIKNFNLKNIIQRIISLATCIIVLFLSLSVWNIIVEKHVTNVDESRTSKGFFSNQIIAGMSEYYRVPEEEYTRESVENNEKISEQDKEKIIEIIDNKSEQYKNFALIECTPYVQRENNTQIKVIYLKNENISVGEAVGFLTKTFFENPKSILVGYFNNYLTTIGVYKAKTVGIGAYVTKELSLYGTYENDYIGYNIYKDMKNNLNVPEHYEQYIENYNGINRQIKFINAYMLKVSRLAILTFKIFLLMAPILLIITFIKYIVLRVKKVENKKMRIYEILIILYAYSFLNVLMNSVLGALIDRYAISSYIAVNLAVLIHVTYLVTIIINKVKERKNSKGENKNAKNSTNNTSI